MKSKIFNKNNKLIQNNLIFNLLKYLKINNLLKIIFYENKTKIFIKIKM